VENRIYIARTLDNRIKVTTDVDVLPTDAIKTHTFFITADLSTQAGRSEKFFEMYEKLRLMETIGFDICIDFGSHFYETGGEVELPHSMRVTMVDSDG
jgi:hypothetical protein